MEISREAQERLIAALGGATEVREDSATSSPAEATPLSRIVKIIEDVSGVEAGDITAGSVLTDDLHLTSLALIEISVKIEDDFRVELTEDEIWSARTVGDLADAAVTESTAA